MVLCWSHDHMPTHRMRARRRRMDILTTIIILLTIVQCFHVVYANVNEHDAQEDNPAQAQQTHNSEPAQAQQRNYAEPAQAQQRNNAEPAQAEQRPAQHSEEVKQQLKAQQHQPAAQHSEHVKQQLQVPQQQHENVQHFEQKSQDSINDDPGVSELPIPDPIPVPPPDNDEPDHHVHDTNRRASFDAGDEEEDDEEDGQRESDATSDDDDDEDINENDMPALPSRPVIDFDTLPEPFQWSAIDIETVDSVYVIKNVVSKETIVIHKPDRHGHVKLWIYTQTMEMNGEVMLDFEERHQSFAEVVGMLQLRGAREHKFPIGVNKDVENKNTVAGEGDDVSDVDDDDEGDDDDDDDTAQSPAAVPLKPWEVPEHLMTEEQHKARSLYEQGEALINTTYGRDFKRAYKYFEQAASVSHLKALEYMAFGHLFGDFVLQNFTRSKELFDLLTELGLPKSQLGLGIMYSTGLGVNSSQAKALVYFTFGALGGESLAQMALGYRYWAGVGVESSCEIALTYYKQVAKTVADSITVAGGPVIQRVRIQDELESPSSNSPLLDDDMLQYYTFLADKGDVQAQVVLGQLYYQGGRGVPVNHERALHYFRMAEEFGNANAMAFLGKMCAEGGPAIEQDYLKAFRYFKKAMDKNSPVGQCGLGTLYFYGRGVKLDYVQAFKYFSLAAEQGWAEGQLQLGIMYFGGRGIRTDHKLALKYFNLASQSGNVLALYHLAAMHADPPRPPRNEVPALMRACHTAVELFKNVAERGRWSTMLMDAHSAYHHGEIEMALLKYTVLADLGYEVAQSNVAYILDQGQSDLFNEGEMYGRALLQWSRAAAQGYPAARVKMGDYHYYGYGTEIDYEAAALHYRMASDQQNSAQAMFNLGYMHENGLGLQQDVHLAKRFYDLAAAASVEAQIPVKLALFKLGMLYGFDVFSKEFEGYQDILLHLDPRLYLGPDWDIYIITFLIAMIGLIFLFRRQR